MFKVGLEYTAKEKCEVDYGSLGSYSLFSFNGEEFIKMLFVSETLGGVGGEDYPVEFVDLCLRDGLVYPPCDEDDRVTLTEKDVLIKIGGDE